MKRFFTNKKAVGLLTFLGIALFAVPFAAHAEWYDALINAVNPVYWISRVLELTVLPLAAGMMAFTGYLLDAAVKFSLGTSYVFGNLNVINDTWYVIRNICNLFFIFALIWISISIILNVSSFNAKRRLTQLIIAALVINFSLYFTKVFVDVGNIFGNWLYNGILAAVNANKAASLSALIASKLDIFGFWGESTTLKENFEAIVNGGITTTVVRLLVILVATYVFMYTTILFITRAVTIIFLLMLSPIGFVGGLLPQIEEYSKKWWRELTDAITFPIIFLLMLYISLNLINNIEAGGLWSMFSSGTTQTVVGLDVSKLFKYIIVIAALLTCLKVAKDSAGELGKAASGIAGGLSKFSTRIGASGIGLTAFAGRRFVGKYAAGVAEDKTLLEDAAGKRGFARQMRGIANIAIARKVASSSFDLRGVPGASELGKMTGVDLGKAGGKGGYKQMVKDAEKRDKGYAEAFGDSPEGIDNQVAYAKSQETSILNRILIGKKATLKTGQKLGEEVGKTWTKAQTQEAQKDAQKTTALIVTAQMTNNALKKAKNAANIGEADEQITYADSRLDDFMEQRERYSRGDKVKLISHASALEEEYNELRREGRYDEANELAASDDFMLTQRLRKGASADELADSEKVGKLTKDDLGKAMTGYKTKVIETQKQIEKAKSILAESKNLKDLMAKKNRIALAIEQIDKQIIGEEGDWDGKTREYRKIKASPDEPEKDGFKIDPKTGEFLRKTGSGLNKELSEQRRNAQKKKGQSRDVGAEGGGGGGGKKEPEPDDDDEEEN